MHSLLKRQLKRRFGATLPTSPAWLDFINDLDEAYRQFDADRRMLERSLELSSQELLQANKEIRTWAEVQLERSEERYRALIENGSDIITVLASNGEITYNSPSVRRVLGYEPDELVGQAVFEFVHPDDLTDVTTKFSSVVMNPGTSEVVEFRFRHKGGSWQIMEAAGRAHIDKDGLHVIVNSRDVTDRRRAEETSRENAELFNHLAYHDPLTGLPNRALFRDRLNTALARARRRREVVTVMFLDLDRFKLVNDTLGHAVGDSLLQSVASQLKQLLRDEDTIARIGGDEFTILLPDLAMEFVRPVLERILECVKAPRSLGGREMRVTTSIGVCQFPADGDDAETLMRNADIAMYRAKEQGRDGYALYNASLDPAAEGRLALENDLRAAIEREEFVLFYQPLISVSEGQIVALEALLRWQNPERGLVLPGEFIPIAEETGLILPLGEWVLRTACKQVKAWQDAGLPVVPVAVNFSGYRFHYSNPAATIGKILSEIGLDAKYLHLEITEGVVLQDIDRTVEILAELREMGIQVSIDDFGTGYSSLSYLKRLPADAVKIDRSFVSGLATDANDAAIATAIIAMSHSIGLKVIAEGVETEEQLAFLQQRRCDEFQGFLRARPMPVKDVELLLKDEPMATVAR